MPDLYPEIEPVAQGMFEVTGGDLVYWEVWLGDGRILRDVSRLAEIPGILVHGRFDFQAPLATAWNLHRLWPRSELVVVDDAGHAATNAGITKELIRATDRFARE